MTTTGSTVQRFATYPSLRDRASFVTGGANGIGAEMVRQLAQQGARVAFVDIDEEAGRWLQDDVAKQGDGAPLFLPCDVRDVSALQRAITSARDQLGALRLLVSNAANDTRTPLEEVDQTLWDDRMAVNLRPHFFAAQAVAPMMREAGGGSIVNVGSISAHI